MNWDWQRNTLIFIINLLLVLIQTSFLPAVFPQILSPVLPFSIALSFLAVKKIKDSYFSAFVGGLLLDIAVGTILGLSSFVFLVTLLVTRIVQTRFFDNFLLYILSSLVFSGVWVLVLLGSLNIVSTSFLIFFVLNYVSFFFLYFIVGRRSGEQKFT